MIENKTLQNLLRYGRSLNDLLILFLALFYQFLSQQVISFEVLQVLYLMVTVSFVLHFLSAAFFSKIVQRPWLMFSVSTLDILWIALLQAQVQLPLSVPLLMNVVVIVITGLLMGTRTALLTSALASLGVAMAFWFSPDRPTLSLIFLVFLQMLTYAGVAGLSGLLAEQLAGQGVSLDLMKKLNAMILQTLPSGLITIRPDLTVLRANAKAQQLLADPQVEGKKISSFFPQLAWSDIVEKGKAFRQELRQANSLIDLRVLPQGEAEMRTFLVVFDDLTEIRRLEQVSRQNEKMAAVGQLAAGIAHEIRNPLASISGSLQLMAPTSSSEEEQKLRSIALREIDRLNRLISEFLDFAKPMNWTMQPLDLSKLLSDLARLLVADPRFQKVQVSVDIQPQIFVRGADEKLRQVFLNLAINAAEAMSSGKDSHLKITLKSHGEMVDVLLVDNGEGMDAETLKRVFEPFFTTKPKGTGLGLALVHKILEAHRATITVESQKQVGTTIKVSFPSEIVNQA